MFGYVKPCEPELKVKEQTCYRAVYCGLCKATGGGCSKALLPAKLALRYDTVFLALFRMMLEAEPTEIKMRRCLLHPFRARPMASASPAVRYSAAAGSLLLAHSLRDRISDAKGVKKAGARLLSPYAASLRRAASRQIDGETAQDSLDGAIAARLSEMHALEAEQCPSPDRMAHLFGVLLGEVFAYELDGDRARGARQLGYHLGKWIYLADAVDDLERDRKSGSYNPFLFAGEPILAESIQCAMLLSLRQADEALSLIEGGDAGCRAILENVLRLGLPEQTKKLLDGAMARKDT